MNLSEIPLRFHGTTGPRVGCCPEAIAGCVCAPGPIPEGGPAVPEAIEVEVLDVVPGPIEAGPDFETDPIFGLENFLIVNDAATPTTAPVVAMDAITGTFDAGITLISSVTKPEDRNPRFVAFPDIMYVPGEVEGSIQTLV